MDLAILDSMGRAGYLDSVDTFEKEAKVTYDPRKRELGQQLHAITDAIERGDVGPALG